MKFVDRPTGPPKPNILLYGPPKSGKTAGACSMPGGILLFNNDLPNATRFARSGSRDPDGRILELEVPAYVKGQQHILDLMTEVSNAVARPQDFCDTVITDPMGELYRRLLDEQASRSLKPTFDHRLAVTTYIERYCRFLCELPHISAIFVCHELPVKDEATESFEKLPFTGTSNTNLGQKLMGMVDIIGYTQGVEDDETGEVGYYAQLMSGKGRRGGDRFDCLGTHRRLDLAEWMQVITAADSGRSVAPVSTLPPADTPSPEPAQTEDSPEDPTSDTPVSSAASSPASGSGRGRRKAA